MKNVIKFVSFLVYVIGIFFIEDLKILILLGILNFAFMKMTDISIKNFLETLKFVLPFFVFTAILNAVLANLKTGVIIGIRLFLAYQITNLFSKQMTQSEFAKVIEKILYPLKIFKINPEEIGMIVSISLCVLPILKNEIEQKKDALKAKGCKGSFSNLIILVKPVLISILRRTSEMEKTLKAKGFEE